MITTHKTYSIGAVETGARGERGYSAYELWIQAGNKGTEEDFFNSLKGDKGFRGARGEKGEQGEQGVKGDRGEKGEQGEKGDRGEKGEQGEKGDRGEKGDSTQELIDARTSSYGEEFDTLENRLNTEFNRAYNKADYTVLKASEKNEYDLDTVEGTTIDTKILGQTKFVKDGVTHDEFVEGATLQSVNKISILSTSFNQWNFDDIKTQNEPLKMTIEGNNEKFNIKTSTYADGFYVKINAKASETYVFSGTVKGNKPINYRIMSPDFKESYAGGNFENIGAFKTQYTPQKDMVIIARIWINTDPAPCECENFYFGLLKGNKQPYKQDKKDILLSNTLRSIQETHDTIEEVEGKNVLIRRIGYRQFQQGDVNNDTMLTDNVNTQYILEEPTQETINDIIDLKTYDTKTYIYSNNELVKPLLEFNYLTKTQQLLNNLKLNSENVEKAREEFKKDLAENDDTINVILNAIDNIYTFIANKGGK